MGCRNLSLALRLWWRHCFPFFFIEEFNPHHKTEWKSKPFTFSIELLTFHLFSSAKRNSLNGEVAII